MQTVIPKTIPDLLTNPGIGFIAAPHLMGNPAELRDNRGVPVEKYRFLQSTKTWNHPDSGLYYCGGRWKELEPGQGKYRWDILDEGLEKARRMGCTSIVRVAPYALRPEEDVPSWMREKWPEEPDYPFWRVDPNTTAGRNLSAHSRRALTGMSAFPLWISPSRARGARAEARSLWIRKS